MAVHEEPTGEERGRAVADRVPIFSLLGAEVISSVGNNITTLAVPWFVLVTTGSAVRMGLTGAAMGIGSALAAVLGGPLVDRLGFKRASVLADLICAGIVVAIPLLYLAGDFAFWQLLVLVFLLSCINTPGDSARYALIPGLAGRARMPIERANAADRAIARLAQVVGPLLAGGLITLLGAANVLFVDAATFVASAALVALGVPSAVSARVEAEATGRPGYLRELLDGLRFVRWNALVLSMFLVATVTNFLDVPLVTVILPVYAREFYGSAASLGAMVGSLAGGAFVGTLLFGAVGHRLPRRLTLISCFVLAPLILYAALVTTPPLEVVVAAGALAGLISGPINPLYETVIQEQTPPQMLGRVFGALQALAMAGIPFGTALAGFAVAGLGLIPTIAAGGVIYVAVTLSMFFRPALRQLDAPAKR